MKHQLRWIAVMGLMFALPSFLDAGKGVRGGSHGSSGAKSYSRHRSSGWSSSAGHSGRRDSGIKCVGCERDTRGRIKRSESAKDSFKNSNPCPSTGKTSGACPGYEIDHKQPLSKGGPDSPSNMQWLSKEQHKEKTKQDLKQ